MKWCWLRQGKYIFLGLGDVFVDDAVFVEFAEATRLVFKCFALGFVLEGAGYRKKRWFCGRTGMVE